MIGLDIGERRIGVALSDPTGRVATPLQVLDAAVEPTLPDGRERCLWFRERRCGACVEACPIGALQRGAPGEENLDKARCYARLLEVEARLGADVCGKCALGPCAQGPAPIP